MERKMYHTQERRRERLSAPIMCRSKTAWLGEGFYFFYYEIDAHFWGKNFKQRTGYYDIYAAELNCEGVLDTVFNERHYDFWVRSIEKAARMIRIKTGRKARIKDINTFFKEKGQWNEVKGIMYNDSPFSEDLLVDDFNYRKRIQLVVFDEEIICNFVLYCSEQA